MTIEENNEDKNNKRIKRAAKIFANAQSTIDSLDIRDDGKMLIEVGEPAPMPITPIGENGELFELEEIKTSFIEVRRGLQQLIHKGQRLMNQTGSMDLRDMTASQVEAIAALSATISNQMESMLSMYRTLIYVEKERKKSNVPEQGQLTVTGDNTNVTQTTVFVGDTAELLKHLNQNRKDNNTVDGN